jgi:DNA replication protein DnaC
MEKLGEALARVTPIRPSTDSSGSTEAVCQKCGSKPPFKFLNPAWSGKTYWDRMLDCDCDTAAAWRDTERIRRDLEDAERRRLADERRTRCSECGGDGHTGEWGNDGTYHRWHCDCEYGWRWNIEQFNRAGSMPKRFQLARLSDFPPEIQGHYNEDLFFDQGTGLFIHGGVGSGKTHFAAAVVYAYLRIENYDQVLFATMPDLLDRIRATYNGGERDDILERALTVPVLVLDDLGTEKVTDWVLEKIYQIVNHRYNDMALTICTSNYAPSMLAKRIGERAVSRLLEMCRVVKLEGADRRVKS